MSKHKTKATPIVWITKVAVKIPKHNIKLVRQIEDSPTRSMDKVRHQGSKITITNSHVELSYPLIYEFWDVFGDEVSTKRLSTCKNIDEYENMVRSYYTRFTLFVISLYYDKCKTVFGSIMTNFLYFMDYNEKIALATLFEKNKYNWVEIQFITYINSYVQKWYKTEVGKHFWSKWMHLKYVNIF